MAKCKIFYACESRRSQLDEDVRKFLNELEENGHTFLSMNTISYGERTGYVDHFRTEIVYQENHTRKVLVEKKGA